MKKYRIVVSEPWDFQSKDGKNLIVGEIIERINDHCILFKSNSLLNFGETSSNILKLTPRFKGDDLLNLNEEVDVNGGLFKGQDPSGNTINTIGNSDENFTFVLIGSIKRIAI